MKLTARGKYALLAMADIASVSAGGEGVRAADIAARQNISKSYLEQILPLLKKAGLLESKKGLRGGYVLAKAPEQITAGSILAAVEGRKVEEKEGETRLLRAISALIEEPLRSSAAECLARVTLSSLLGFEDDTMMFYI